MDPFLSSTRFALMLDRALAALLVVPCLFVASQIRRRLGFSELFLFALLLLVLGLAAEATFFLTMLNTSGAAVGVRFAGGLGVAATAFASRDSRFRSELCHPDSWAPFAAAAAGGFAFPALFCIACPSTRHRRALRKRG